MTLPPKPAHVGIECRGGQNTRRIAGVILAGLLLVTVPSRAGQAQDADPFSATVAIDATAESVAKAREQARTDGQRRALTAVIERLSGGNSPPAKLPKLDDKAITGLV